jgi:hypothetical protein
MNRLSVGGSKVVKFHCFVAAGIELFCNRKKIVFKATGILLCKADDHVINVTGYGF